MTNSIQQLPKNTEVAKSVLEDRHRERGMLGKIFGSKEHAPTNIVGLVVTVAFVAILALVALQVVYPSAKVDTIVSGLIAIVTSALGYLFGRTSAH